MVDNEKRFLVTGSEGLVGSRFVETSKFREALHSPKLIELDILNRPELQAVVDSFPFSAIINFAAFTDIKAAEAERGDKNGLCWRVNVEGPRNLAEAVASHKDKIILVHISTDMVFSGDSKNKGPYDEKRIPDGDLSRLTWYGYTKLQGEKAVQDILGEKASILRIIYPVRAKFDGKSDFLRKPLELYDQGKLYPIFDDQQISVSFIDDVCLALDRIIERQARGVMHASSSDLTTPFEIISFMLKKARGVESAVVPQKIDDFVKKSGQPNYRYPKFGGLLIAETEKKLGINFKNCEEIVNTLMAQGLGK